MPRYLLSFLAAVAVACSQTPSDQRPWRATDHDHTETPNAAQADVSDGGQTGMMGIDEVAIAAWRANCVPCHGVVGRGDGPKGIPLKARNLTDPAWQATITDEQIATSIREGKGEMPKVTLPASTVDQLVKLVRLLNRERAADPAPPSSDAGAPSDAGTARAVAADSAPARAPDAGAKRPASADAGLKP